MSRNRPVPAVSETDSGFVRSLIIHEDEAVLAFNKPSGLPVQGGRGISRSLDNLLWAFARSNGKRPRLVHRLDTGTSGIIIVARTKPAAAFLSAAFSQRAVEKRYLAVVWGDLPDDGQGEIDVPLAKVEESGRTRMIAANPGRAGAQDALTRWTLLSRAGDNSLLELKPDTGRMHQLRAHLSLIGCPILGDALYGRGPATANRLLLHAHALSIPHPDGGELALQAPLPEDFRQCAEMLQLTVPETGTSAHAPPARLQGSDPN